MNVNSFVNCDKLRKNVLTDLNDQQLVKYVTDLEEQERHLRLENMVLENFLTRHDPSLITSNINSNIITNIYI